MGQPSCPASRAGIARMAMVSPRPASCHATVNLEHGGARIPPLHSTVWPIRRGRQRSHATLRAQRGHAAPWLWRRAMGHRAWQSVRSALLRKRHHALTMHHSSVRARPAPATGPDQPCRPYTAGGRESPPHPFQSGRVSQAPRRPGAPERSWHAWSDGTGQSTSS